VNGVIKALLCSMVLFVGLAIVGIWLQRRRGR